MERITCPGCQQNVDPLKLFEKSPATEKWWLITRCPRERCGYNLDLAPYDKPGSDKDKSDGRRSFWKGDHWD